MRCSWLLECKGIKCVIWPAGLLVSLISFLGLLASREIGGVRLNCFIATEQKTICAPGLQALKKD